MRISKSADDNKIKLTIKEASIVSKSRLNADTWQHIAVTFAADTASIYFDGNLDKEAHFFVSDLWMLSQDGFRLGANIDGTKKSQTCFDDLFFLNDALTKAGVLDVMGKR
jgi:hypothetical protein